MSAVSLIKYKKFQKLKSIVKLENSPKNYSGEFFCLLASRNLNNNQRAWIFNELNLPVDANLAELGFYKPEFKEAQLEKIKKLLAKMPHPIRWALSMLVGFTLLLIGLIMIVTPGPGLLFLFFGLSILALELEWAREMNKQGLQGLEKIVAKLKVWFKIGKKDK